MLRFYDTLHRDIVEFIPVSGSKHVKFYSCGPTVHDFVHIGNLRSFIFYDWLKRYLEFRGYTVTHVMNITDVEDKLIKKSKAAGRTLQDYTEEYTQKFFADLETVNCKPATHYPRATHYIKEMVEIVENLLKKGIAYKAADGSVYYNVRKFQGYGKLSHLKLNELESGASGRVKNDEYDKEHASDFALWKAYDPAEDGAVFWETSLGKGRPGWHIECSAMSMKLLGETFDIHTGAVDLIFPHHENEIAQSEGASGKMFSKYWVHGNHLIVDGKKMSKSLGNFYILKDVLAKGFSPAAFRYYVVTSHYRSTLNFTFDGLSAAQNALKNLANMLARLTAYLQAGSPDRPEISKLTSGFAEKFVAAMDEDLNSPVAASELFQMLTAVLKLAQGGISPADFAKVQAQLSDFSGVFGLILPEPKPLSAGERSEVEKMIAERGKLRAEKKFTEADAVKKLLSDRGVEIIDAKTGTTWFQGVV